MTPHALFSTSSFDFLIRIGTNIEISSYAGGLCVDELWNIVGLLSAGALNCSAVASNLVYMYTNVCVRALY